jgi:hypothetical protein
VHLNPSLQRWDRSSLTRDLSSAAIVQPLVDPFSGTNRRTRRQRARHLGPAVGVAERCARLCDPVAAIQSWTQWPAGIGPTAARKFQPGQQVRFARAADAWQENQKGSDDERCFELEGVGRPGCDGPLAQGGPAGGADGHCQGQEASDAPSPRDDSVRPLLPVVCARKGQSADVDRPLHSWLEVFLQERGYLSLLRRLNEVLEMEWRCVSLLSTCRAFG